MSDANVHFSVETLEPRVLLAAFEWTGAAGDSLWNNVANWSADGQAASYLPTIDDNVTIENGANVVLNGEASIKSLQSSGNLIINSVATLSAESVDIYNGAVTVNGGWNVTTTNVNAYVEGAHYWERGKIVFNSNVSLENLNVFGGAFLDGTGNVIVSGAMTWGGALYGTGRLIIASDATMAIENNTYATLKLAKTIDSFGIITWKNDWISSDANTAVINNYGTFNVESDKPFYGASDFNNFGTFEKTGGTLALNRIEPNFYNSGIYSGMNPYDAGDPTRFNFINMHDGIESFELITSSGAVTYTPGEAVTVDSGLTITDPTGANRTISSAFVTISEGYIAGQDVLFIPDGTTGITGYFDEATGMLLLFSTPGITDYEVGIEDYEAVLQTVMFSSTATETSRILTLYVSGSHASGEAERNIETVQELSPQALILRTISTVKSFIGTLLTKGQAKPLIAILKAALKSANKENNQALDAQLNASLNVGHAVGGDNLKTEMMNSLGPLVLIAEDQLTWQPILPEQQYDNPDIIKEGTLKDIFKWNLDQGRKDFQDTLGCAIFDVAPDFKIFIVPQNGKMYVKVNKVEVKITRSSGIFYKFHNKNLNDFVRNHEKQHLRIAQEKYLDKNIRAEFSRLLKDKLVFDGIEIADKEKGVLMIVKLINDAFEEAYWSKVAPENRTLDIETQKNLGILLKNDRSAYQEYQQVLEQYKILRQQK